jgi:hypothetical protein
MPENNHYWIRIGIQVCCQPDKHVRHDIGVCPQSYITPSIGIPIPILIQLDKVSVPYIPRECGLNTSCRAILKGEVLEWYPNTIAVVILVPNPSHIRWRFSFVVANRCEPYKVLTQYGVHDSPVLCRGIIEVTSRNMKCTGSSCNRLDTIQDITETCVETSLVCCHGKVE